MIKDLGRIAVIHRGEWQNGNSYDKLDVVSHGGSSYMCVSPTTEQPPSASWKTVALKGDAFAYSDFTDEQIASLMRPATDAAKRADDAIGRVDDEHKQLELLRQSYADSELEISNKFEQVKRESADAVERSKTAATNAESAVKKATDAATKADTAAGKATDAAGLAETAKTNANTAAGEANSAATKAETAASSANSAAESASSAAVTAGSAASTAGRAADEAESAATKAEASANKADIAAGKANEATVAATNAATKANEVEAKLTGNILKGKVKDTLVHVDDAFPSSLLAIEVEGACKQDGTPSPDNPVPIEVIEHPVVMVTGRNLVNVPDKTVEALSMGTVVPCGLIPAGTTAYISMVSSASSIPKYNDAASSSLTTDDGGSVKYSLGLGKIVAGLNKEKITADFDATRHMTIYGYRVPLTAFDMSNYQLEVGGYHDYRPYTSQSIAFTLPAEHPYLAKLPDGTADEIRIDREGNVELVARVGKAVNAKILSSGTAGELDNTNGVSIYGFIFDDVHKVSLTGTPKEGGAAYCDKLYSAKDGTESVTNAVFKPRSNVFVVNIAGAKDENDAKAKFDALKSVVYAPIVEKHYQLGKIEMPKVQDSISNVWTDAEITPRTGIEYTRDVNIVVANLESAIASIS